MTDWPQAVVEIDDHGQGQLNLDGRIIEIAAADTAAARHEVVTQVGAAAARLGRPIVLQTHDPSGNWVLAVGPDGTTTVVSQSSLVHVPAPPPVADGGIGPQVENPQGSPAPSKCNNQTPITTARRSFLTHQAVELPAAQGIRGLLNRMGFRFPPSSVEQAERADRHMVSQHWPGPRTVAFANGKGGVGKTPCAALFASVMALHGAGPVIVADFNPCRGSLPWRTEQGQNDSTILDLLPEIPRLLGPNAQASDLASFVHHQPADRYDVLRSQPLQLASEHRLTGADVDAVHELASKYYRIIVCDSGNDESHPMWRRMMDHTNQLVVPTTTRDDHAEAGALLLEALSRGDEHSAHIAARAVVVVTQADPTSKRSDLERIADGFREFTREVAVIPFDPALVEGQLRFGALRPATQRAWLAAAAAITRGF